MSVCHFERPESSLFVTSAAYSLLFDTVDKQNFTNVVLPCAMMTVYRHTAFLANVYLLLHLAQAAYVGQHPHLWSWPSLEGDC